jgi:hypothetical protein
MAQPRAAEGALQAPEDERTLIFGSSSVAVAIRTIVPMAFSRRIATLAAVVAIPLGIAATSFALTDSPEAPKVPPKVELDKEVSSPAPTPTSTRPSATPSDEVVPRPPVTDGPASDDDDDDRREDGQDDADDGAGDDG